MNRSEFKKKAQALVDQMTVEEAAKQLSHFAPAIERLNIPAYPWWNEALHGVARAGIATVFPQAIGMAATFTPSLVEKAGQIIATEARAKYNAAQENGDTDIYKGLTMWSPNINIFRDPRWGRGHETYGEDPYLTSRMGVSYIRGVQGDGKYLKASACAKHFAVHSGPESIRHGFDAQPTQKDLHETYLPAFKAAVQEGHVDCVMGAYNAVHGEPCCAGDTMLRMLREEWGFEGIFLSDAFAVEDLYVAFKKTGSIMEAGAHALSHGTDLCAGTAYYHLMQALDQGLITEEMIRNAAVRCFTTRMALGLQENDCEYNAIPYTEVCTRESLSLAQTIAEKSITLLTNDGILPLHEDSIGTIGVIGPNAYSRAALYANYTGDSANWVTNLDGIRCAAGEKIRVLYSAGCHLHRPTDDPLILPGNLYTEALAVAKCSDVVILCVGLDATLEGEEGDAGNKDSSGDKKDLLLPAVQRQLCELILNTGKPVVLVVNSGSALDLSEYESRAKAIVQCWYSGERGGAALANVLFGKVSPSGRLPVTFYYHDQPIPAFDDYHMAGRTYRFLESAPWMPFGYGLSYTQFAYGRLQAEVRDKTVALFVPVKNTGTMTADEVIQLYARYEGEAFEKPACYLCGIQRVTLNPGEEKYICMELPLDILQTVAEDGSRSLLEGRYSLYVGGNAPDERSCQLTGNVPQSIQLEITNGSYQICPVLENIQTMVLYPKQFQHMPVSEHRSKYSLDTPMRLLYDDPRTRGILQKFMPQLIENYQVPVLGYSLRMMIASKNLPEQVLMGLQQLLGSIQ